MQKAKFALISWLLMSSITGEAVAADSTPFPWSERGVFVFGPIVLDFWKHLEFSKPYVVPSLTNCSTADYYCADGDIIHVVLPRHCAQLGETKWSVDGMETMVLASLDEPEAATSVHPWGSGKILLLGDEKYTNVVYEYDPIRGVRGIYWDPVKKINVVEMAREGKIKELVLPGKLRYSGLETLDTFGKCEQ